MTLEDDSATEWIYQFFGSETVFLATTYMRQKKENPILELTNAKKLTLLQEMTFGKNMNELTVEDPDYYTEKITSEIKATKDEILRLTGRLSLLEEQYLTNKNANKKNIKIWKNTTLTIDNNPLEMDINCLTKIKNYSKNLNTQLTTNKKKLIKLRKEWENYNFNKIRHETLLSKQLILENTTFEYTEDTLNTQIENLTLKKQYDKKKLNLTELENELSLNSRNFWENNLDKTTAIQALVTKYKNYTKLCKLLDLDVNISEAEISNLIIEKETLIFNYE